MDKRTWGDVWYRVKSLATTLKKIKFDVDTILRENSLEEVNAISNKCKYNFCEL